MLEVPLFDRRIRGSVWNSRFELSDKPGGMYQRGGVITFNKASYVLSSSLDI